MKQIRKRLTYANVMSSIAVFLVLGGATAFAAKKIGANEIKANSIKTGKIAKEAVTTGKIKNDAINGAKVNESSLGQVPSAGNANTVNGQTIHKIAFRTTSDVGTVGPQTVLNAGGLLINVTCSGGDATVSASTTKNDSSIYVNVFDGASTPAASHADQESGEFDIGETVDVLAGGEGNNNMSFLEYDAVDGSVVTALINTDEDGALDGCRVTGHATSG